MNEPIVKISNLKKSFKFVPEKIQALNNISFDVSKGEVTGLLGLNGAGKTTTVKILLNFIEPDEGHCEIFGINSAISYSREKISYLPEKISLQDELTPLEYFLFLGKTFNYPKSETLNRKHKLLELVSLKDKENVPIGKFSKGMLQRIGLALTLFNDPEFIILDEPLTGLDPLGMKMMEDIILTQKNKNKSMLVCSHNLDFIQRAADKVVIIHKGNVLKSFHLDKIDVPLRDYFFKLIGD